MTSFEIPVISLLGPKDVLHVWTVYARPSDYPDKFVARRWDISNGVTVATSDMFTADSLEEVRTLLPQGLHCLRRFSGDDPTIAETWL